jgi:hypothetical protein
VTEPTAEEQIATFQTATFKDGDAADGTPTAEETAAHLANSTPVAKADDTDEDEDEDDESEVAGDDPAAKPDEKELTDEEKAAAAAEAKPKGKKASFNERIGDVTAKWRTEQRNTSAATARAEAAERELADLKAGKTPLTPAPAATTASSGAPDPSQFDYGELDPKYIAALSRFETLETLKAEKAKDETARQAEAEAATRREQATKQGEMLKAGIKLHDDFDEVVMQGAQEGKWQLSPTLGVLLLDSEFGPQIAYELAKNPDEATRVYNLAPSAQAAHFGRQEAKLEAAKPSPAGKPAKTPQAQTPPKLPKGGSGSAKVSADSSDFAAVEAAFRSGALQ